MKFTLKLVGALAFLMIHAFAQAQFTYSIDQSIPVEIDGKKLTMPWAGGLNAAQINTMDLNGDTKPDLVVFERTINKVITFINQNNQYIYSPDYESFFPAEVDQWMLLRDFNCDGKKDIFTSDPFGMVAFVNTTQPGKQISWRAYDPDLSNKPRPIRTQGFSIVNLVVRIDDVPAIDDVDGDGDLDILNFYFVGQGVEWHKNISARCDTLQLQRITQEWGSFQECNCGKVSFDGGICINPAGRTQHTVGRSLLSLDLDSDGARELFFSEESCANLYLLNNEGTADNASMTSFSIFQSGSPLSIPFFPTPYYEDIDFDGAPDLIVSPNLGSRGAADAPFLVDFQKSLYLFKNTGTKQLPQFNFTKSDFLQGDMIDVGDYSVPAFFDFDGDGDQDLFVSNYTKTNLSSTVHQFENVGTAQTPSFKLINEDFFFLSTLNQYNLKIQFADMNGDAKIDFVFSASAKRNDATQIYFLANSANDKLTITDAVVKETNFFIGFSENWLAVDVDQDGLNDLLVGNDTGAIEYWKNQGPATANKFTLMSSSFLGLGSPDRQNLAMAATDLDADGLVDLIVGDQRGKLSIFGDFRAQNTSLAGAENIIFNEQTKNYESRNLGGQAWPTTANLFNSNTPSIVVGNLLGGLMVLKNDGGKELPAEPEISIYPNPFTNNQKDVLKIRSDRNVTVQFYTVLGQKISNTYFIPVNQDYPIDVSGLAAGLYIARFTWKGKTYGKRFVILN
jgi:hypothetical protein